MSWGEAIRGVVVGLAGMALIDLTTATIFPSFSMGWGDRLWLYPAFFVTNLLLLRFGSPGPTHRRAAPEH